MVVLLEQYVIYDLAVRAQDVHLLCKYIPKRVKKNDLQMSVLMSNYHLKFSLKKTTQI